MRNVTLLPFLALLALIAGVALIRMAWDALRRVQVVVVRPARSLARGSGSPGEVPRD